MIIPHKNLSGLLFGQQHILTQFLFINQFGQSHTIELKDLPHYKFLCEQLDSPFSDHAYSEYLTCSWDYYFAKQLNTRERRNMQIKEYLQLYNEIKSKRHLKEKAIENPIKVCKRPDGRTVIVDGNHRAAIALKLGLDIRASFIPLVDQLDSVISVPEEFYGTKHLNRPYQSVYYRGKELIKGRRLDLEERMHRIAAFDLENKSILDLGSNLGVNCFLAADQGAAMSVGVEGNPKIASAASRLNAYFAAPCYFIVHDLNNSLKSIPKFDTVFCFSLVNHLKSKRGIVDTIKRTVGNVLYFEGHAGTKKEHYEYILNSDTFSSIDLIGYGHDGIHVNTCTRPLYRCEVKKRIGYSNECIVVEAKCMPELFRQGNTLWNTTFERIKHMHQRNSIIEDNQVGMLIPRNEAFILVDENQLKDQFVTYRRVFPFLERDGEYWGPPSDNEMAILEFERLRQAGANFIVFAWPAFWWLDYYTDFHRYLRSKFRCVIDNERLVIFDLRIEGAIF